jgi:putative alpha-1,2-mannosidase
VIETTGHRERPIGADGIDETPPAQYVQRARLDGEPLDGTYIPASALHRGGVLQVELGPEPSGWGRAVRPPSVSAPAPGGGGS